ncbi:hypothetical protein GCM10027565_16940 [Bordetella tumulicola]
MNTSISAFKYNFRASGSKVQRPIRYAIAIPSHRVVLSGSTLWGYRWGAERKRALLAEESEQ